MWPPKVPLVSETKVKVLINTCKLMTLSLLLEEELSNCYLPRINLSLASKEYSLGI